MSRAFSQEEWAETRRASIAMIGDRAISDALPTVLLGYQAEPLELLETVSVLVIEKSRRIGMTWGLAAYAVLRASRVKSAGGMDAMYISYSQEMTREYIDACSMWAKAFAIGAFEEGEFLFDDTPQDRPDETRSIQAFRIRFASGFEIIALSSAPRSLRGKQGAVIIDEAAFVDNISELLKAALAFLMWGGQVIVVSTHNGANNPFAELVTDIRAGKKPYKLMTVNFDEALRQGLYQRICLVRGKEWSPEAEAAWRQEIIDFYGEGADEELFCVPRNSDGVWLPSTLVEARMTEDVEVLRSTLPADFLSRPYAEQRGMIEGFLVQVDDALDRLDPSELHGFGYDVARYVDLACGLIMGVTRKLQRRSRLLIELRRWPYKEQAQLIIRILRRLPRFQKALIDATGSGDPVAEEVARAIGASRVIGVKLSTEWYRVNMPPVKSDLEDGSLTLIRDREVGVDLRTVQIVQGVPLIPKLRTIDSAGGKRHGDSAIALVLAHASLRQPATVYEMQSTSELEGGGLFEPAIGEFGNYGSRGLW